jgi:ABC-2 type transport system permease protein
MLASGAICSPNARVDAQPAHGDQAEPAYGAHVPGRTALALAVTVVIGAASFCCLGYALTSLIRNEDAALPTTQALLLPLYFISGVFVPVAVR